MDNKNSNFNSLWHSNESVVINNEPLPKNVKSDFVIVGGGYTGLSTALHLALKGKEVTLLEAGEIGSGASGLNGGQLNPGLKHNPQEIIRRFGTKRGKQIMEFVANTPKKTISIIKEHKIDCQLEIGGFVQPAHNKASLKIANIELHNKIVLH